MPLHVRANFLRSFQKTLDAGWDFRHLENLTPGETDEVDSLREDLTELRDVAVSLVERAEKRTAQLPTKLDGPAFSWALHDARCAASGRKERRRRLAKRLAKIESQLKKLEAENGCVR